MTHGPDPPAKLGMKTCPPIPLTPPESTRADGILPKGEKSIF